MTSVSWFAFAYGGTCMATPYLNTGLRRAAFTR
jgi:hypothetical protein